MLLPLSNHRARYNLDIISFACTSAVRLKTSKGKHIFKRNLFTMSNKLITDTFPKVKKQKIIKQKHQSTKTEDRDSEFKRDLGVSVQDEEIKHLSLLKEFDLNSEYGPCIGISRLQRWERAEKFGLHPSQDIKDIITQHLDDETYTECIWKDEKL